MLAARNGLTDVVNQLLNLSATISISKDAITAASEQANEAGFQGVVGILRKSLEVTTLFYQFKVIVSW